MNKGLTVWMERNNNSIVLDADNAFWGIINNKDCNGDVIIPRDIIALYERFKERLDKELHDFRFSQELSAIYIDPTDKCNANCSYCYVPPKIRRHGRSMTENELGFILEKIAGYFKKRGRKPVIVFHASEPLLVKEMLFEAIKKYNKLFKFGLQTNALLLTRDDVEFLKEQGVGVGISLDADTASLNNRQRPSLEKQGNFEKAVKAIEWFDGYEGLNILATVTKFNVRNLPAFVKFLHAKKAPCVLLNPVRFTRASMRVLKPDDKTLTKYFIEAVDTAITLSQESKHKIIIGNFSNIILGIVAPTGRRLMCDISPCGGGRCFFTVTASGEMIPCGEFIGIKEFSGGNIYKTTIEQAMLSPAFKTVRSRTVEKIEKCDMCIFRNICGSPCPAELHSLGDMYQPSVFCEFYKEIIKYAFRLIAEGKEKYCFRRSALNNLEYAYCVGGKK